MSVDWRALFIPSGNLAEIVIRGTFVYLFLFATLRFMRREAGAIGISDLLVVVLIADAAQNAMGSDYRSITEGLVLVATICFWDFAVNWLSYHVPAVRRVLSPGPVPLVKDGKLQRRNLRQELITEEDLMGLLREHGVERIEEVKRCYLEGDGHISVIKPKAASDDVVREKRRP